MKIIWRLILVATLFIQLSACTSTMLLDGALKTQRSQIIGKATISTSQNKRIIEFSSSKGLSCRGPLGLTSVTSIIGTISCSDGRIGTLSIKLHKVLPGGKGSGKLSDGEQFEFSVGTSISPGEYSAEIDDPSPLQEKSTETNPEETKRSI